MSDRHKRDWCKQLLCGASRLPFLAAVAGFATPAFAQETAAAPSTQREDGLEEIVVVAQRRAENQQDVPITISTVTGDRLREQQVDTLKDVAQLVTGISIRENNDQRNIGFLIRGVGSNQSFIGIEPSAAVNVDGEVLSRNSSLFGDINDLESVSILKGPQGTLFGKNSVAGAMVVTTRRPRLDTTEGNYYLALESGTEQLYGGFNTSAMYNLPVGPNSAVRVNAFVKDSHGWVPNVIKGGENGGSSDGYGARAQLLHEFDDTFSILGRIDFQKVNFGPGIRVFIRRDDFAVGNEFGQIPQSVINSLNLSPAALQKLLTTNIHELSNTPFGPNNNRTSASPFRDNGHQQSAGASLEVTKSFGDGYELISTLHARDTNLYTNDSGLGTAVDAFPLNFAGDVLSNTYQHELRIASPVRGPIDFVAGTFFLHSRVERNQRALACQDPGLEKSTVDAQFNVTNCGGFPFAFNAVSPATSGLTGLQDLIYNREYRNNVITANNAALFGQANFHASDKLTLVLGGRLIYERQKFRMDVRDDGQPNLDIRPTLLWVNDAEGNRINFPGFGRFNVPNPLFGKPTLNPATNVDIRNPAAALTTIRDGGTDWAFTYKAAVQYEPIEDIMLYANYSTGFKGAAYFSDSDLTQQKLDTKYPIPGERARNMEFGVRSEFFNRKLRFNATYFDTEFRHYQDRLTILDNDLFPIVNGGLQNILNNPNASGQPIRRFDVIDAGTLKTKGWDIEADWQVTRRLALHAGWSRVDARFADTDVLIPCRGAVDTERCTDPLNYGEFFDYTFPRRGRFFPLDGARLANAPKDTVIADATYTVPIGGWSSYVRWNYRYKSKEYTNHGGPANNDEGNTMPKVGIHNLFLGVSSPDKKYSVNFSVKNIFNKHYYVLKSTYGDGLSEGAIGGALSPVPELVGIAQAYPTYGATPDGRFFRQTPINGNVPRDFERYVGLTFEMRF